MGQKSGSVKEPAKQVVKEIRRATRRQFSAEEKIRIVLSGLRGEDSIAELCRREGIVENLYYRWSKEFFGSWQETPGRRHRAGGDLGRGQGSASGGQRVEGSRYQADTREPAAQKKHDRGWGRRHMRYAAAEKLEIIRWSSSPRYRCAIPWRNSAFPGQPSIVGTTGTAVAGRRP